ncbi:MAG: hypothetical protein VXW29_14585 [SAR324 cluster bacterium]|nr:hypothetical protein [SAR324 cluster bacterium]
MAFLQILILATILGLIIGAFSLLLVGSQRAERYPGLAIIPGALIGFDLGLTSQWGEFSLLVIGGLTGYFLMLGFWRDRPSVEGLLPQSNHLTLSASPTVSQSTKATDAKPEDQLANYI